MIEQFFGTDFKKYLLAYALLLPVAAVAYFSNASWIFLIFLFLLTFVLSAKKMEWGMGIALFELMSNAHGLILFASLGSFVVSARMVIFAAVMLAWLYRLINKKETLILKRIHSMFVLVLFAVVIGFVNGLLHQSPLAVFKDGNAYLYLGYLLPLSCLSLKSQKHQVLQMLSAASIFIITTTLLLFYAYTHFSEDVLRTLYVFLRDIRLIEITRYGNGFYRVFEQTQFFVILFVFALLPFVFQKQTKKEFWISFVCLSTSISIILLSFSRSFWFGLIVTAPVFLIALFWKKWICVKQMLSGFGKLIFSGVSALVLIMLLFLFPIPANHMSGWGISDLFSSRAMDSDDVAISSRWNLLPVMLDRIQLYPVTGSGFGKTVTFKTDDPRARAIYPDGTWTTYAMEWGWLELWLKMGILGPLSFAVLFISFLFVLFRTQETEQAWIHLWLIGATMFLLATHTFSPYVNHPIGLGTILLIYAFLPTSPIIHVYTTVPEPKQTSPQPSMAGVMQQDQSV